MPELLEVDPPPVLPYRINSTDPTTAPKEDGKFFLSTIFCSHKYHKILNNFSFGDVNKFFLAKTLGIIVFLPKILSLSYQKYRYGFRTRDAEKTYPGSKRHRIPDPQHCRTGGKSLHDLNNSSPSQPTRFLTDLIVFVPERLQLLLAAQIPEIQPHAVRVDLANVEPHRGRDLGQVGPLVVAVEAGLGRLQEGGLARIVQPKDQHKEFVLLPGLRIHIDLTRIRIKNFDDQKLKKI